KVDGSRSIQVDMAVVTEKHITCSSATEPCARSASRDAKHGPVLMEVDQISKRYKNRGGDLAALDRISFGVFGHEFLSIIGPSGCGKTSLLMIIGGLVSPSTGTVRIGGLHVHCPYSCLGGLFQAYGF